MKLPKKHTLTAILILSAVVIATLPNRAAMATESTDVSAEEFTIGKQTRSIADTEYRMKRRSERQKELNKEFVWWPTDAKPGAVLDEERGGYWWWPTTPGKVRPWGNRGYVYIHKIIFDYKSDELPPPKENELRPSLLIRRIIKNVKVYFDYDGAELREDAKKIVDSGIRALNKNGEASILITGNADTRGTDIYNKKLAKSRAEAVRNYIMEHGITEDRIRTVSKGKLNAAAPVTDLVGMQKDRNAQFMVAEIDDVMLPYQGPPKGLKALKVGEGTYLTQEHTTVESDVQVSTREYVIQDGDTLSKIAHKELGSGHRWNFLYQFNKDRIKNPDKLKPGQKILIPIE